MVHHHLFHHHKLRKSGLDEKQFPCLDFEELHQLRTFTCYDHGDSTSSHKKYSDSALIPLFVLLLLLIFSLILVHRSLSYPYVIEEGSSAELRSEEENWTPPAPCSSVSNNSICCDRTAYRTDICFMRGDVRTYSTSNSILLITDNSTSRTRSSMEEKIRPYTRKWETSVMDTIDELSLRHDSTGRRCDVRHDAPAVVFSTGGYTGNVYHEFNDGIIPLYITSQHFNKKVVFVVLEYHDWWIKKYGEILSLLSEYPPIDFRNSRRTHCFSEAIVGLRIHDELTVDAARMVNNKTMSDFHQLLAEAYNDNPEDRVLNNASIIDFQKPKLVIMSRRGSRKIENEGALIKLAKKVGFQVKVLRPNSKTQLADIFRVVSSCDAMLGVHGAAMTHLLFMRPGSVLIQIVPVGTDWAAEAYYGQPAAKMGLQYMAYNVSPAESSLYKKYGEGDLVVRDPESVNAKGWKYTKKVYLDGQNVRLDMERFQKPLVEARRYVLSRRRMKVQKKHR